MPRTGTSSPRMAYNNLATDEADASEPGAGGPRFQQQANRRHPDEAEDEDMEGEGGGSRRGKKKQVPRAAEEIPVVKDQTGERVRDSFIGFLER